MYRLEKTIKFEASHQLPNHDGKCKRLHGHSWSAVLAIESDILRKDGPKVGMIMDYSDISAMVSPIVINYLDHHHLNTTTGLTNPTSEALAEWIYNRVAPIVRRLGNPSARDDSNSPIRLVSVMVRETCTCACTYVAKVPTLCDETSKSISL